MLGFDWPAGGAVGWSGVQSPAAGAASGPNAAGCAAMSGRAAILPSGVIAPMFLSQA